MFTFVKDINMGLKDFMKRFWNRLDNKENGSIEEVTSPMSEEIWKIINSNNYQWENFNKVVSHLENFILKTFGIEVQALKASYEVYSKKVFLALNSPLSLLFVSEEFFNKDDIWLEKISGELLVDRVQVDSLGRHYIIQALNEILNISSAEEFGDRNYKIWDIEINSFEDLEQHRAELENMREKRESYNIPGFKEAVEYAAKNGIGGTFYS